MVRIVHRPGTRGVTVYTFVLLLLTFTSSIDDSARWRIDYSPTTTSTTFVAADTFFGVLANAASSSCFVLYFSFVFYVEFDFAKVRLGVAPGRRAAVFARAGLNHLVDGVQ